VKARPFTTSICCELVRRWGGLGIDRLIFFTPVEDEELNQSLDSMGRITVNPVASM